METIPVVFDSLVWSRVSPDDADRTDIAKHDAKFYRGVGANGALIVTAASFEIESQGFPPGSRGYDGAISFQGSVVRMPPDQAKVACDIAESALSGKNRTTILEDCLRMGRDALRYDAAGWLSDPIVTTNAFVAAEIPSYPLLSDSLQNAVCNQVLITGRWAVSGFPVLNLTHKLAATLMATNVSAESLVDLHCPWPAVLVKMPSDLLYINNTSKLEPITLFGFSCYDTGNGPKWSYQLTTEYTFVEEVGNINQLSLWAFHIPQDRLVSDDLPSTWNALSKAEIDVRSETLARRLMVGLCLWCSDPKNLGEPMRRSKRYERTRHREPGQLPDFKLWSLGREVKLDERVIGAVRAYVREGGRSPKVQSLVRGHWKRQAHGLGRSQRKMIHVEPYWRGPLDAPVLDKSGKKNV